MSFLVPSVIRNIKPINQLEQYHMYSQSSHRALLLMHLMLQKLQVKCYYDNIMLYLVYNKQCSSKEHQVAEAK
jgi:hypothetical protein